MYLSFPQAIQSTRIIKKNYPDTVSLSHTHTSCYKSLFGSMQNANSIQLYFPLNIFWCSSFWGLDKLPGFKTWCRNQKALKFRLIDSHFLTNNIYSSLLVTKAYLLLELVKLFIATDWLIYSLLVWVLVFPSAHETICVLVTVLEMNLLFKIVWWISLFL